MKKIIFALVISCALRAEIIEVAHFEELTQYQRPNALFILDIDNTLIVPVQELGCEEWFYSLWNEYRAGGMSVEMALEKALALWEAVQHVTEVRLVEPRTDGWVRMLQDREIPIIGLTTRGLALATRTVAQLASVGIDLAMTAPSREDLPIKNGHTILYRKGIFFTSGTHKGDALMKLLKEINCQPGAIIFINDNIKHLQQVEESCQRCDLPFIGLRYGFMDEKVKNYRPEIAAVQQTYFKLLSDEIAESLINKQ